jgi:hypothetical protein
MNGLQGMKDDPFPTSGATVANVGVVNLNTAIRER